MPVNNSFHTTFYSSLNCLLVVLLIFTAGCKKKDVQETIDYSPTIQAHDVLVITNTYNTMVRFVRGNGSGVLVVRRAINTNASAPKNGHSYSIYGTADTLEHETGKDNTVLYVEERTANDTISVLLPSNGNNEYAVDIYEFDAKHYWYKTPPATFNYDHSFLKYRNNLFTDVVMTVDGIATTIKSKNTVSFTGLTNVQFNYTATTTIKQANGLPLGAQLKWQGPDVFPYGGATVQHNFELEGKYFFLYITNYSDSLTIKQLITNEGNSDELSESIVVNADSAQHLIAYYKLNSDTQIKAYYRTRSGITGFKLLNPPAYQMDNIGNTYVNMVINN